MGLEKQNTFMGAVFSVKTLFAILTCNRLYYLKNCFNSLKEFVDDAEVMIIDNCTIEKGADDFFKSIETKAIIKRFEDRVPNELYRAMNYAVKYCLKNKIPIICFLQDDYQFLYKNPELLDSVTSVFKKHKYIGQLNVNLIWRRKKAGKHSIIKDMNNWAVLQDKMLVDNGFTRTNLYKKTGLYPSQMISYDLNSDKTYGFGKNRYKKNPNGEIWFGSRCRKMGYSRAISLLPNQGMMFDCSYVRMLTRFGNYFPPPNQYYLKPFNQSQIDKIKVNNSNHIFSYIEDMVEADGWTPTTYEKHNLSKIKRSIVE